MRTINMKRTIFASLLLLASVALIYGCTSPQLTAAQSSLNATTQPIAQLAAQKSADDLALAQAQAASAQLQAASNAATGTPNAAAASAAAAAAAQSLATIQAADTTVTSSLNVATQVQQQLQAAVTALQAQVNNGTGAQVSAGASTIGALLPPPWGTVLTVVGGIAAAYFASKSSTATAAANTAQQQVVTTQTALTASNASLQAHQVALAAVSGSTVPLTTQTVTTLVHPALTSGVVVPAVPVVKA